MRTDFMLFSLLDGALSPHMGPTWPARERVPARGYQVIAGASERDRMEATPVRWISARRAGIASPQAYVFHRSSRRARFRVRCWSSRRWLRLRTDVLSSGYL